MTNNTYSPGGGGIKLLYIFSAIAAVFSGFAQMPIMKRYYVADLPGMSWAANFYTTSDLHYIAVALLMFLFFWRLTLDARTSISGWSWGPRSWWGWLLVSLLFITGVGKVIRNTGMFVPPDLMVALDLTHMMSGMFFMITAIIAAFVPRSKAARAT